MEDKLYGIDLHLLRWITDYISHNPKYTSVEELAPPYIGGQTPIPMPLALDDLELGIKCIKHFFETGQLYPESGWAVMREHNDESPAYPLSIL